MNRRLRLITLALIFTSVCVFLAWSDYRYPPFEPHPDGQRAEPPDFGSQDDLTKTPTEVSETPQAQITTSPAGLQPIASSNEVAYLPSPSLRVGDAKFLQAAPRYIQAIMDVGDDSFPRLSCPVPTSGRYEYLRNLVTPNAPETSKYFFALNLRRSVHLLPRLLGSIVEAMYFLGPGNCALSIVEGHSEDGTFEVLLMLSKEMERMRVKYFFESSDVNPEDGDGDHRISALAELRNQALQPLMENPALFSLDSMVFFINDVSLCMEDTSEDLSESGYDMRHGLDF
jgi:alpha-1,3-mannosyltransferase